MRHTAAAVTLSLFVLGLSAGLAAPEQAQTNAPPVLWVEAKAEHAGLLDFAGLVQPRVEADLAFRTLGRVISRNVKVGDIVKKGDVLMTLDPLALEFSVRSAEAAVRSAQATLDNAKTVEARRQSLRSTNSGSQADLELAQQALISAQASRDEAQAKLDKAREQLGYATLTADFDGAITATSADVGQTVALGQTVLSLARLDQRDAVVDVPEPLLTPIRATPEIAVDLELDRSITAPGALREIAPEADATTRTYRIKIAIDSAPKSFRLGSVVTVRFSTQDGAEFIRLPPSAIFHKDNKDYVWRFDEASKTVKQTELRIDPQTADNALVRVLSGLSQGDKIVAAGVELLKDGQAVTLGQERRT